MTSEKPIMWGAAAVVLAGIGALYYFYAVRGPVQVAAPPPQVHPAAPAPSEPAIEHPVPASKQNAAPPLPELKDSDQPIASALTGIPNGAGIEKFLVPQNIIRHVVATIDNLPRKKVAVDVRPVKSTSGEFEVSGTADHLTLNPDNFKRYGPFVDLVKTVDANALAAVYFRFYPLFQQAYEDLGYPTEYFNDRVIEVIDHLLETPDVQGPIELVQPNVMYLYADPKLEALSAGQKTLIRMGPENAGAIKMKLRELRNLLATHSAPGQAARGAPAGTGGPQGTAPSSAAPGQSAAPAPGPRVVPAPQPSAAPAPAPPLK
ncbi:MAG TPA: DUF3014 domain-containing protein [Steroidobacteraceae bacterium]